MGLICGTKWRRTFFPCPVHQIIVSLLWTVIWWYCCASRCPLKRVSFATTHTQQCQWLTVMTSVFPSMLRSPFSSEFGASFMTNFFSFIRAILLTSPPSQNRLSKLKTCRANERLHQTLIVCCAAKISRLHWRRLYPNLRWLGDIMM